MQVERARRISRVHIISAVLDTTTMSARSSLVFVLLTAAML